MDNLLNVLNLMDIIKEKDIDREWCMCALVTFLNPEQVQEAIEFFNSVDVNDIDELVNETKDNTISMYDINKYGGFDFNEFN